MAESTGTAKAGIVSKVVGFVKTNRKPLAIGGGIGLGAGLGAGIFIGTKIKKGGKK